MNVIYYTRDSKGNPHGMLVALPSKPGFVTDLSVSSTYDISWSHCGPKDHFSRADAMTWARLRHNNDAFPGVMPHDIRKALPKFVDRCKKYYKDMTLGKICNTPKKQKDFVTIESKDGHACLSPNHLVLTENRGWIRSNQICPTDKLVVS